MEQELDEELASHAFLTDHGSYFGNKLKDRNYNSENSGLMI